MKPSIDIKKKFTSLIWNFYQQNGRSFEWRSTCDPYAILISEIMLQQTQTSRVIDKYPQFINKFPHFRSLAEASLCDVLRIWQGLGYNRRTKYLCELAKEVVRKHNGILPAIPELLVTFSGIGKATAGSICAFAFNMPTVFIETNIRSVFIHYFFQKKDVVSDSEIMPLIVQTVDHQNPREWYYAIMDYGVELKRISINPSRRSKHYTKQSKFEGSNRQIRGSVIRQLTMDNGKTMSNLIQELQYNSDRIKFVVNQLLSEGMIIEQDGNFSIMENPI